MSPCLFCIFSYSTVLFHTFFILHCILLHYAALWQNPIFWPLNMTDLLSKTIGIYLDAVFHYITNLVGTTAKVQTFICNKIVYMQSPNNRAKTYYVLIFTAIYTQYVLTHTTKGHLKCNRLIIKNLVGKGNRTLDRYYNNSMTIAPLA